MLSRRSRLQIKPNLKPKANTVQKEQNATVTESFDNSSSKNALELTEPTLIESKGVPAPLSVEVTPHSTCIETTKMQVVSMPRKVAFTQNEERIDKLMSPPLMSPTGRRSRFNSISSNPGSHLVVSPNGGRTRLNSTMSTYSSTSPTRHKKKKFTGDEHLDTKTMRMIDLIAWNPKKEKGLEKKLFEEADVDKPSKEHTKDAPVKTVAPQVTIGPDGRIVLDEASLVISEQQQTHMWDCVDEDRINRRVSSLSFRKRMWRKGTAWTEKETELFYEILRCTGPDFGLMHEFFPTRARNELKSKYNREERFNWEKMNKILSMPAMLDESLYDKAKKLADDIEEEAKLKKDKKSKKDSTPGASIDWDETTADLEKEAVEMISQLELEHASNSQNTSSDDDRPIEKHTNKRTQKKISAAARKLLMKTENVVKIYDGSSTKEDKKKDVVLLDGYGGLDDTAGSSHADCSRNVPLERPVKKRERAIRSITATVKANLAKRTKVASVKPNLLESNSLPPGLQARVAARVPGRRNVSKDSVPQTKITVASSSDVIFGKASSSSQMSENDKQLLNESSAPTSPRAPYTVLPPVDSILHHEKEDSIDAGCSGIFSSETVMEDDVPLNLSHEISTLKRPIPIYPPSSTASQPPINVPEPSLESSTSSKDKLLTYKIPKRNDEAKFKLRGSQDIVRPKTTTKLSRVNIKRPVIMSKNTDANTQETQGVICDDVVSATSSAASVSSLPSVNEDNGEKSKTGCVEENRRVKFMDSPSSKTCETSGKDSSQTTTTRLTRATIKRPIINRKSSNLGSSISSMDAHGVSKAIVTHSEKDGESIKNSSISSDDFVSKSSHSGSDVVKRCDMNSGSEKGSLMETPSVNNDIVNAKVSEIQSSGSKATPPPSDAELVHPPRRKRVVRKR